MGDKMDAQQTAVIDRLTRIFDRFLEKDFTTNNDVYFNKLITHLSAKENLYILQAPFTLEWLEKCITIVSENFNDVNPKVISFMLNFCGLLTLNEWILIEIKERRIFDRTLLIVDRDRDKFSPSIKLGSIRLLSAISRYSLGLHYIRLKKVWRCLIDYCYRDHTLYVLRESRQLLYELLYKFSVKTNDEPLTLEMLNEILKPITENTYEERSEKIIINVNDPEIQHKLVSALDLLSYIFQQTLESDEKTNIIHLCIVKHNMETMIWKLTEMAHNALFLEKIVTTLSSFNFARLVYEEWTSCQIPPEKFNTFGVTFFNMMKFLVGRRECGNFLKMAELNHVLWKKLGKRAPSEIQIENQRIRFENQLITFQLMPVLFLLKSKELKEGEIIDAYIVNLCQLSCDLTFRLCYAFRDVLCRVDNITTPLNADLAYKAINGIVAMENTLEREQAVLVFQAMIYALKEFILNSVATKASDTGEPNANTSDYSKSTELIVQMPNVLYAALIGLQMLIKRYRITWKESIETICLVNSVSFILENPNLTTQLAVQALKLVQLAIEHFLAPNMALLVDNLQGSGLVCLGPIIVKRFHDIAWEVRDSTLELTTSIANISCLKFPAFQRFLIDFGICPIVYQLAVNDCESYVRASALKCLAQMVAINMIWESELNKLNLFDHLFHVLFNESEGIVRKEAVCTLTQIYDHRKIPNQYKDTLYSTLAHCVLDDLHWEVQVNALHFWELEIQKQFENQGMIDGTFPTVTFSKEHKKIVQLTEKEVNLRIAKVLNELGQRGCLGIILRCLNDDYDLEVIKTTVCMVQRLMEKLNRYDYESIVNSMDGNGNGGGGGGGGNNAINMNAQATTTTTSSIVENNIIGNDITTTNTTPNSDEIIEGILDAQDINLLAAAYEKKLQLTSDETYQQQQKQLLHIDKHFYKKYASVTAKEFISKIKTIDLEQLLQNHNEWFLCSESFTSLLDDIQIDIKPIDIDNSTDGGIFADCY